MNFFEHQAKARRVSLRLSILFALAVLGIVIAVNIAIVLLLGLNGSKNLTMMLVWGTLLTLSIIGGASLYRISSLRGGGAVVAEQMGGVEVPENTRDFALRRLRNVVEEIAIASGVPVPRLYVLENEPGINAFAAGYSPADAAVAVTRGALDQLNREELQGVIAHEFSHILNGDMRLNVRLIGVLFGIMVLSIVARYLLQAGGRGRGKDRGLLLLVALAVMVIGYVGVLFGRIIKAGISRQRELLADASAVQFTRQTSGLAGALKKIAGVPTGAQLTNQAGAEEVSHMLFGQGLSLSSMFSTHPPILKRIQELEPGFNARALETLRMRWAAAPPNGYQEDVAMGLVDGASSLSASGPPSLSAAAARTHASTVPPPLPVTNVTLTPDTVTGRIGALDGDAYRHAHNLIGHLSPELRELAYRGDDAMPLLLALLLDDRTAISDGQLSEVAMCLGAQVAERTRILHEKDIVRLHPMQRLPLAALTFPALRRQPKPQLEVFLQTIDALAHIDGEISLFEYCLSQLLQTQVREVLHPTRYTQFGRNKPGNVKREFATLLAVVAQAGHADPAEAQRAYLAGWNHVLTRDHMPYQPPADGVRALDEVWEPLNALNPLAKQVLLEALVSVVSHDQRVSVEEAELLRTICGVLHCPLPALLEQRDTSV
ncbi:MAG: M48 family metallopeptidase [Xanthomonadaceae bacterium]|jgi:Zn-dependent protease with chaperone function|nr:M48 family metallopeptidase [Xanthomonadaceae bacterium]